MNKRFGEVLVLLLCITILAGYVRKDELLEESKGYLIAALSSALGQRVEFESAQWTISAIPYLEFKDVSIGDIKLALLRVDLSNESLIRGEVLPVSIRMKNGSLNYERLHQLMVLSRILPDGLWFMASDIKLVDDFDLELGAIKIVDKAGAVDYQNCQPLKRQFLCISGMPEKIAFYRPLPPFPKGEVGRTI